LQRSWQKLAAVVAISCGGRCKKMFLGQLLLQLDDKDTKNTSKMQAFSCFSSFAKGKGQKLSQLV
jgi:hypothetical protein